MKVKALSLAEAQKRGFKAEKDYDLFELSVEMDNVDERIFLERLFVHNVEWDGPGGRCVVKMPK